MKLELAMLLVDLWRDEKTMWGKTFQLTSSFSNQINSPFRPFTIEIKWKLIPIIIYQWSISLLSNTSYCMYYHAELKMPRQFHFLLFFFSLPYRLNCTVKAIDYVILLLSSLLLLFSALTARKRIQFNFHYFYFLSFIIAISILIIVITIAVIKYVSCNNIESFC